MLYGANAFTTVDMEQGFHQIRVEPHDQYTIACRTCMGQYELKAMLFGLRRAPRTFERVMNQMAFPRIGRGVNAYLDDLLAYTPDVESHVQLLDRALQTLKGNKMYLKIFKCNSASNGIEYLGYRVCSEGITPSEKVKAIEMWPEELQNDTQVKQFFGTINDCRFFMGFAFAGLVSALADLTLNGAVSPRTL